MHRLRSRFEWGLIVDIQPPDYETRMAILQSKAERMSAEVSNDILSYIATNIESNIRELEGALNRVLAMSKLTGLPLDRTVVEKALGDLLPNRPEVTAEDIIKTVSSFYGVSPEESGRSLADETIPPFSTAMSGCGRGWSRTISSSEKSCCSRASSTATPDLSRQGRSRAGPLLGSRAFRAIVRPPPHDVHSTKRRGAEDSRDFSPHPLLTPTACVRIATTRATREVL